MMEDRYADELYSGKSLAWETNETLSMAVFMCECKGFSKYNILNHIRKSTFKYYHFSEFLEHTASPDQLRYLMTRKPTLVCLQRHPENPGIASCLFHHEKWLFLCLSHPTNATTIATHSLCLSMHLPSPDEVRKQVVSVCSCCPPPQLDVT